MDVHMCTVGVVQENCFLLRRDGAPEALIVDHVPEQRRRQGQRSLSPRDVERRAASALRFDASSASKFRRHQ